MAHNLQKFAPRHFKILDLAVAGLTTKEIAEQVGMTTVRVNDIIRSPSFQHQFSLRRAMRVEQLDEGAVDEVREVLKKNAKKAADKLVTGLSSLDSKVYIKSATEILDRAGYGKQEEKQQNQNLVQINISSKEALVIKESLDMLSG